ncbi:MAG: ATP-dependent zinc protease [Nitrococcus mobilis]|nr:ATP-dependent zinc protease [Nitrococcus mobilis]
MPAKAIAIAALLVGYLGVAIADGDERRIFGWVEMVRIESWDAEMKAKLDTGALTSSMQAEDIEEFEKDGKDWVRFTVEIKDEAADETVSKTFERPLYRDLEVHGAGGEDHRPVVLMNLCIGNAIYEEQFSLEDRDDMNYPILLGRRTIQSLGLVDVAKNFLHELRCTDNSPVHEYQDKEVDEDIGI